MKLAQLALANSLLTCWPLAGFELADIGTRVAACQLMYSGNMARYQLEHGCLNKALLDTAVAARKDSQICAYILVLIWHKTICFHYIMQ